MCDEKKLFRPAFLTFAPLYHFTLSTHWKYHQKATGDYVIASYFSIECNTTNTDQSRWEGFFYTHEKCMLQLCLPSFLLMLVTLHCLTCCQVVRVQRCHMYHQTPLQVALVENDDLLQDACTHCIHSCLGCCCLRGGLVERLTSGLFQK